MQRAGYLLIIKVLEAKGVWSKWLITQILRTASTSILLNGVPGKKIFCERGVRPGDPLSPLLYVIDIFFNQLSMMLGREVELTCLCHMTLDKIPYCTLCKQNIDDYAYWPLPNKTNSIIFCMISVLLLV